MLEPQIVDPVTLTVSGKGLALSTYPILWVKYVRGFDQRRHCAHCLVGPFAKRPIGRGLPLETPLALDEAPYDYLYLCGLPWKWTPPGVHIALRYAPGQTITHTGYAGNVFTLTNAAQVEIPELPERWNGLPHAYTSCRNFQFGVHAYGWTAPAEAQASLPFV